MFHGDIDESLLRKVEPFNGWRVSIDLLWFGIRSQELFLFSGQVFVPNVVHWLYRLLMLFHCAKNRKIGIKSVHSTLLRCVYGWGSSDLNRRLKAFRIKLVGWAVWIAWWIL